MTHLPKGRTKMNVTTQQTLRLGVTVNDNGERVRLVFRSNHCFFDPDAGSVSVEADNNGRAQLASNWPSDMSSNALPEWNDRLRQLYQALFDGQPTPDGRRIYYVNETPMIANGNELTVFTYLHEIKAILDFVRPIIVKWLDPSDAYSPSRRYIDDVTIVPDSESVPDSKPVANGESVPDSKSHRCQSCKQQCPLRQSCSH